ncbi:TlpA disulfide reductase family protein [Polaribacter pacificus]|uniref:TlpA disulfide reductase family protein n=1 Tax=Polaribacter pacificus TaxID=1775173 RepID=UPI00166A1660|nr:TlpA disulfide reductase family protein [Polaribacter pacificus]
MKKLLILFFLASVCLSCTKEKTFLIKGTISGDLPKYIYLSYDEKKDSALIRNNNFIFRGKVLKPTQASFYIIGVSTINKFFYIDNSNLQIKLTNTIKTYQKNGNDIQVNFINIDTVFGNDLSVLEANFERFKANNKTQNNWKEKVYERLDSLISINPKNLFFGDQLYSLALKKTLTPTEIESLFSKLNLEYQSKESINGIQEYINPVKKIAVGNVIFDFQLPTPDKTFINTTQYRGKYLFIHFWASWCAPCRKDNIELKEVYAKYKKHPLHILNVSTDTDLTKWKNAIKADGVSWDNVVDDRKSMSDILAKYDAISSIPKSYLIDPDGQVILANPTIEELKKKLNEVIKN